MLAQAQDVARGKPLASREHVQYLTVRYDGRRQQALLQVDFFLDLYDVGMAMLHIQCPVCMKGSPEDVPVEADCGGGCACDICVPAGAAKACVPCGCACHHDGGYDPGCTCRFRSDKRALTLQQQRKPFSVDKIGVDVKDGKLTVVEALECTYCHQWRVRITNGVAHDAVG